jgi:hypothetical protein
LVTSSARKLQSPAALIAPVVILVSAFWFTLAIILLRGLARKG